jgi:L-ribulose-5-phosphate 4-epimerase
MLESLKSQVLAANLELVHRGLVLYTFGNASGIDRDRGLVAIKPSGVPYETMTAADMVISDLDGKIIDSKLKPSSDLATHLELYRAFPQIGGVVHTHSEYATGWAQA